MGRRWAAPGPVLAALRAARSEVLGDGKARWRWREAWEVLSQGFGEAKRAAAEGVEAIRAENDTLKKQNAELKETIEELNARRLEGEGEDA